ncbi:MAG: hypothetical protein IKF90_15585, partial [Parasporobacterium sp.]|nr:hypothetical protein [Parasporobacterium sp.]
MKNLTITDSHILYYISLGIFLFMTMLRNTFYYQYVMGITFKAGLGVCVLLILINELIFGRLTRRAYISIFVCGILIALFFLVNAIQYKVMMATILYSFAARKIPFKNIARFAAIICTVFLLFVFVSAWVGIIENYEGLRDDGTVRYYLGFLYALYPATVLTNITFLWIYYRKEKILWRELLILLLANFFVYFQTDSRLVFISAVIAIVISGFLKLKPDFLVRKRIFTFILAFAFVFCAVGSLIVSVKYNPDISWQASLNDFLGRRLYLQHEAMMNYGFSLFGQDIHSNGYGLNVFGENPALLTETYFYVDNDYIRWFTSYGLVFFVFILALLTVFCLKSR